MKVIEDSVQLEGNDYSQIAPLYFQRIDQEISRRISFGQKHSLYINGLAEMAFLAVLEGGKELGKIFCDLVFQKINQFDPRNRNHRCICTCSANEALYDAAVLIGYEELASKIASFNNQYGICPNSSYASYTIIRRKEVTKESILSAQNNFFDEYHFPYLINTLKSCINIT